MPVPVENIPDGDGISYLVAFPRMYDSDKKLIWNEMFQFPTPPDTSAPHESAIWRKYVPSDDDVHGIGVAWEAQKQPPFRYVGCVTTTAGEVRSATSSRGHGFIVEHDPDNAPIHHVKISLKHIDGGSKFSKSEKADLRILLGKMFGNLIPRPA